MAATKLAIHVLPDSNPQNVSEMIACLSKNLDLTFSSSGELVEFLRDEGVNANDWVQSTSTNMGILDRVNKSFQLSSLGQVLVQIREDVQSDLLHFLLYTGWDSNNPVNFLQSWGYRNACDRYWSLGEVQLTSVCVKSSETTW